MLRVCGQIKNRTANSTEKYSRVNNRKLIRSELIVTERGRPSSAPAKLTETVETLPALELPGQLSMDDVAAAPEDQIEFLRGACTPIGASEPEFSRAEMDQLFEVLVTVDDCKLPENVPMGGIEFRRYHYLAERYAAMNRAHERKPVKHRFAYLLKLVKADAGTL